LDQINLNNLFEEYSLVIIKSKIHILENKMPFWCGGSRWMSG